MFKVITVKEFSYRGKAEQWSNGYIFSGTAPADAAAWDAFFVAVWAAEKPCLDGATKLTRAYGYDDPDGHSVRGLSYDTNLAQNQGSQQFTSGHQAIPGDVAHCVRFRAGNTSKGKPAYVMKYFHGIRDQAGDAVSAEVKGQLSLNLAKLRDGTLPGGAKLARPSGILCGVPEPLAWKTTRTLKRRGRRPPAP